MHTRLVPSMLRPHHITSHQITSHHSHLIMFRLTEFALQLFHGWEVVIGSPLPFVDNWVIFGRPFEGQRTQHKHVADMQQLSRM